MWENEPFKYAGYMYKGTSKMKVLKCHSGTKDKDIIEFINNLTNNIEKDEEEELKEIMEKFEKDELSIHYNPDLHYKIHSKKIKERKIWIFFDEFNTCNSMQLITEIFCHRTIYGKPIYSSHKLCFLGSVNPYRAMTDKMKQSGLRYPTDKKKELVYSVNPLPYTLLNFVINFGSLDEIEEKQYIKAILNKGLDKFSDQINNFNEFINFATKCISQCHNFIRKLRDISSVSLSEINRINIFFDFFYYYLKEKTKYKQDYIDQFYLLKSALNLSIYSCYYLRISDNKERDKLVKLLDEDFGNKFLKIPLKEVQFITDQFVIDRQKNIILNKSLRENLFSGFISIINKIPLIIVGKPGESKSLSIQILMKSMKGIYSKNDFFQKYPSIIKFDYQGSITSTSNGIIETFNKARNYYRYQKMKRLNKKTNEDLIVLLFFDELGLAERSPNNPLKAIHAELEYSDNVDKIAFIGISNWTIDASKMNRCNILSKKIYLDEKELIDTSLLLYKNICSFNKSGFIESLAKAYYDFLKDDQSNFYGARDFYHLIKNVSKELLKLENKNKFSNDELSKIGLKAIYRNFGGDENKLKNLIAKFEDKFC